MKSITFILSVLTINVSAQNWAWAKNIDMGPQEIGFSMGTDKYDNLYITGSTHYSTGGSGSYYYDIFWKLDKNGNQLWRDTIWGDAKIATDSSGNSYISCASKIAKYDDAGQQLWSKNYPGKFFRNIAINPLGGFVVIGKTQIGTQGMSIVFSCDTNGDTLWTRTGDFPEGGSQPPCIALNLKGESFVGGGTYPDSVTGNSGFFEKIDINGTQLFSHIAPHVISDIEVDKNDNIYITGLFDSSININDTIYNTSSLFYSNQFFIKYDPQGNYLWHRILKGKYFGNHIPIETDHHNNVYLSSDFMDTLSVDGYVYVTKKSTSDCYVMKIDSAGAIQWITTSTSPTNYSGGMSIRDLCLNNSGDIFITGNVTNIHTFGSTTVSSGMYGDMLAAKMNQSESSSITSTIAGNSQLKIFPNPAVGTFNISYSSVSRCQLKLSVTNNMGQLIYSEKVENFSGEFSKTIDLGTQAKGVFFVEIIAGDQRTVKKIVLE